MLFFELNNVSIVSFILNYDLPTNFENYLNAVGRKRTRYTSKNIAVTFITNQQLPELIKLKKYFSTSIHELIDFVDP